MSRRRTLLLTGGSGFIGSNLAEDLAPRWNVLAPPRRELDLLDEDAVAAWFRAHAVDAVVHSVVQPGHRNAKDPTQQMLRNCRTFFAVARNLLPRQRMVWLSSGAVYDARHFRPRMTEDYFDAHVPADEHGMSKYVCARWAHAQPNVVELRLFGVYGPREDWTIRFVSNAICKALHGLPITCRQDRLFDYLWVHDLAPVVEHFLERGWSAPAFNVTPDRARGLVELAELVREVTGADVPIQVAQPGLGVEYSGDNARLRREMPGLALTPEREAIARLTAWYRERLHLVDRKELLFDR